MSVYYVWAALPLSLHCSVHDPMVTYACAESVLGLVGCVFC